MAVVKFLGVADLEESFDDQMVKSDIAFISFGDLLDFFNDQLDKTKGCVIVNIVIGASDEDNPIGN